MRAGELRHRVTLQRLVDGQDEAGQPTQVPQDVATVWAKVEDLTGREYVAARQVPVSEVSTRVTIRWRADVEPSMQVVAGGRTLHVESVLDPGGRRRELQLMCREVAAGGGV